MCTFHPGYGYEDFIEGLRPETVNGQNGLQSTDGISSGCASMLRKLAIDTFSYCG